jgi:hypothetical protein
VGGRRAALLLGSSIASLLALELALRALDPQPTMERVFRDHPPILRPSEILPFELRPGASGRFRSAEFDTRVSINAQGTRGPDFAPDKGARLRVLAVGDSFTAGYGVEDDEAYPSRLDALLGERVEVINAGFAAGYAPDTYYLYLKARGLALDPDLVLVGFFVGNDIDHGIVEQNDWVEVDARGLPLRIVSRYSTVENGYWVSRDKRFRYALPLLRDSHLFQLAAGVFEPWLPAPGRNPTVLARENRRSALNVYRARYLPRTEARVEQTKTLFLAMRDLARERGAAMVVVMIPAIEQIETNRLPDGLDLDPHKPQRIFGSFFLSRGIPYLDLLPPFSEPSPEPLYFSRDQHWTAAGHARASRAIADFLHGGPWLAETP